LLPEKTQIGIEWRENVLAAAQGRLAGIGRKRPSACLVSGLVKGTAAASYQLGAAGPEIACEVRISSAFLGMLVT
jgi:hypothetical protein